MSLIDTKGSKEVVPYEHRNLQSGSQRSRWPVCSSLSAWKWPLSQDRCCADIMHVASVKNFCASHYSRSVVSKTNNFPLSTQDLREGTWRISCPALGRPSTTFRPSLEERHGSRGLQVVLVCHQGTVLEAGSLPWVSWTWGIMKLQPNWKA